MVKVVEIDSQGRINLSRKAVLTGEDPSGPLRTGPPRDGPPRDRGGDRGGAGGRRRRP